MSGVQSVVKSKGLKQHSRLSVSGSGSERERGLGFEAWVAAQIIKRLKRTRFPRIACVAGLETMSQEISLSNRLPLAAGYRPLNGA
ncbi:MAG TPA: hypothetical protein PK529_01330 [Verrucomicrobiales bacterium]|nr:hypothetical protein [Verrucomicrobiales bacterium]